MENAPVEKVRAVGKNGPTVRQTWQKGNFEPAPVAAMTVRKPLYLQDETA
jgi:hypothetical protein